MREPKVYESYKAHNTYKTLILNPYSFLLYSAGVMPVSRLKKMPGTTVMGQGKKTTHLTVSTLAATDFKTAF